MTPPPSAPLRLGRGRLHIYALCRINALALAFSGGLDTSYCVPRLPSRAGRSIPSSSTRAARRRTQCAAIRAQAPPSAPSQHHEMDARADVFDRFVRFLIQGNVLRGEVYPLSVAAERTQQAHLGDRHGARDRRVGRGARLHRRRQRPVRFDIALRVLAPELEIITPIREEQLSARDSRSPISRRAVCRCRRSPGPTRSIAGSGAPPGAAAGRTTPGPARRPSSLDPPADAPAPRDLVIGWEARRAGLARWQRRSRARDLVDALGELARHTASAADPRRRDRARHQGPHRLRGGVRAGADQRASRAGEAGAHQVADVLEGPRSPASTATACTRGTTSIRRSATSRR